LTFRHERGPTIVQFFGLQRVSHGGRERHLHEVEDLCLAVVCLRSFSEIQFPASAASHRPHPSAQLVFPGADVDHLAARDATKLMLPRIGENQNTFDGHGSTCVPCPA
jgi:hypothetical protein